MGKKKIEHVVFDGMRKIKKSINIGKYNKTTGIAQDKKKPSAKKP